ncbi:hypothetical protein [Halorientalis pallida]|uniref:C2H2-type domain-containing protein n=1 Tax=Halorientalis pallida TaxID=2479928 RepID=A0A498KZ42_9EURY|nr:hypothetical protein [Halorientalis pallida]RXK50558.1 hypothetical protein EAF64_08405 [Halorientalis pallida]
MSTQLLDLGLEPADAASTDVDSERRFRCPICDGRAGSEADVYRHLLIEHRKSGLSDALLDRAEIRVETAGE